MILPDVSVLIQAYHPDSSDHSRCHEWLESVVNGNAVYGMSPQVLSSVTRILTDRRFLRQPYPVDAILNYSNRLLGPSHCQVILPGPYHWRIFCDLCVQSDAKGDLISDAWFAALAIEHGCEWITLDRDFARFEKLRWRTPF